MIALGLIAGCCLGCILTQDIPDPALDVPQGYKARAARAAGRRASDARLVARLPFAGADAADGGGADRQSRHCGRGGAVSPGRRAGAPGRRGAAAERQSQRIGKLFTHVGLERQRPQRSAAARWSTYSRVAERQLPARFLGPEPRRLAGGGGDLGCQPVRPRGGGADRRWRASPTPISQVLASQDRLRTAQRNIASAERILNAIRDRFKAGTGSDLDVAQQESVLANQRALVPPLRQTLDQNVNALAVLVSRPPESVRIAGGSLNSSRHSARHAGPAVRIADPASRHPPAGGAARFRHRQCRQRARAVLPEHPADRAGRLPEPGAGPRCSSRTRRSSAWSAA